MHSFSIVIPSAKAENLISCVRAIIEHEPTLPTERIIVVDDGARADAESALPPLTWVSGEKPFIYARNANLGLRAAAGDAILLNDDALLKVHEGFTNLVRCARARPEYGLLSAGIRGIIGNARQYVQLGAGLVEEPEVLMFVCVLVPATTFAKVGPLDERFVGYGYEDNDYSDRVRAAGLRLGVLHDCLVDHQSLPSTFRTRNDIKNITQHNYQLYLEKRTKSKDGAT